MKAGVATAADDRPGAHRRSPCHIAGVVGGVAEEVDRIGQQRDAGCLACGLGAARLVAREPGVAQLVLDAAIAAAEEQIQLAGCLRTLAEVQRYIASRPFGLSEADAKEAAPPGPGTAGPGCRRCRRSARDCPKAPRGSSGCLPEARR